MAGFTSRMNTTLRFHRFLACISQCWKVKRWSSKRRLQNGVALLRMNGLLSLALATRTDLVMKPACTRVQTSRTPELFAFWHRFECEIHEQRGRDQHVDKCRYRG